MNNNTDKDSLIQKIKRVNDTLLQFNEEWSDFTKDKGFVLEMVRKNGLLLQKASDELKNDKEVVIEALQESGWALKYASPALKNDRSIVVMAIRVSCRRQNNSLNLFK